ncbi:MAG TPA: hypothetical protein VGE53_01590 [Candidatus Paceibacterota bacterium]
MALDNLKGHIERLQEKPEHVRHNIAMGVAVGVTALVAAGWAVALGTSGTFALSEPKLAEDRETFAESFEEPASAFSNLMGAAGAAFNATSTEAALKVIETRTSSTLEGRAQPANDTEKTVIPF